MNDTEINQKLHEAMGLCVHEWEWKPTPEQSSGYICRKCGIGNRVANSSPVPNYTGSLDAVSVVEQFVIEKVGKEYGYELRQLVCPNLQLPNGICMAGATATAHQRALACLRALDLWEVK